MSSPPPLSSSVPTSDNHLQVPQGHTTLEKGNEEKTVEIENSPANQPPTDAPNRINLGTNSQNQQIPTPPNKVKGERWLGVGSIFRGFFNYFGRLLSFPLVKDPISFARPGDFSATGEPFPSAMAQTQSSSLEVLCNYDSATKELFERILKDRKEARAVKDNYHYLQVDLSKFPGWNDAIIDRLRGTFQVFDISGDGLVDFDELCAILTEFGDTSPVEEKKKCFDKVDTEKSGAIDFMEFITMIFDITVKNPETASQSLGDSFRAIDRNMSRIRSLDVVQQLQAGLF